MPSMSLENGDFNFYNTSHRNAALKQIDDEKPYCIVIPFPCTLWSSLTNLRKHGWARDSLQQQREAEMPLLKFVLQVCKMQAKAGRHFVLENPFSSLAWKTDPIDFVRTHLAKAECRCDMCMFNKKDIEGNLIKKGRDFVHHLEQL